MDIVTITPFKTNLFLRTGINPTSLIYEELVQSLTGLGENVTVYNAKRLAKLDYAQLSSDWFDLRMLMWEAKFPADAGYTLKIHVYPNMIGVAEVRFSQVPDKSAGDLETWSQQATSELIDRVYGDFCDFMDRLVASIPGKFKEEDDTLLGTRPEKPDIDRVCRMLMLSDAERKSGRLDQLLTDWLAHTVRAEDAQKLIESEIDYSMTWVNYVVIEKEGCDADLLISTMVLAQYFWSAQDFFNKESQKVVTNTLIGGQVKKARQALQACGARMRMLEIEHNALRAVITRRRDKVLMEILDVWGYEVLARNGQLISEMASQKIREIEEKHASKRSLLTDTILGGIGFLAVIEVFLYLHEFSREVMSRPALEYNDDSASSILSAVAEINTDTTLSIGFVLLIALICLYYLFRRER